MQITPNEAICRLVLHGWKYHGAVDEGHRNKARYQLTRPGQTKPEWFRHGALKAYLLHML